MPENPPIQETEKAGSPAQEPSRDQDLLRAFRLEFDRYIEKRDEIRKSSGKLRRSGLIARLLS
ncbi:MAG: hypothetical protein HY721_28325 [Planctomycetes bacterium]|nr:hypothetical protein [Planctomycetota bacterium]